MRVILTSNKVASLFLCKSVGFLPAFLISQKSEIFASYKLQCACHRQAVDSNPLRGAPPPREALAAAPLVSEAIIFHFTHNFPIAGAYFL